jgi:methyltransferase (TIGR00027 family)
MEPLIRNISNTAKWVAIFRAEESERPDAVFHDPFARRLAGKQGEEIANNIGFSKENSWSFVARTFLFDESIKQHVAQGYDMIINLAAGLDARPYRMQLPSKLQWIEVDLPEILNYKEEILANEKPN